MAQTIASYGGVSLNTGTPYFCFAALDVERAYEAETTLRDREGYAPVQDGNRFRPIDRAFSVTRGDTSVPASVDQWAENALGVFEPDGVLRALRITWRGLTLETMAAVVKAGIPSGIARTDSTDIEIQGTFRIPDPIWRNVTAAGPDTASPITLLGNTDAAPAYAVTGDTTTVSRRPVTITDVLGNGFSSYPIMAEFDATGVSATTTANYIAFCNGREIPIYTVNPNTAATRVFFRVDCPPLGTTTVQIYYGSSVSNTVTAQALDPAGMAFTDASFSNTLWVWDNWIVSDNPTNACGVWTYARIEDAGVLAQGITITESAASLVWAAVTTGSTIEPEFDGVIMVLGGAKAGASSALAGVSRAFSNITVTGVFQFRVEYLRAADLELQNALTETGDNVTNTTAIDLDDAIEIAIRCRNLSAVPTVDQTITMTNSGDFSLALTSNPTVSVAAAVTARLIDDSLDVGSNSLDFDRVFVDNVALTVDCFNRTVSPASGPLHPRDLVFSNPREWLPMAPGSNSWTEPDNSAVSVSARESYRVV